jgi:REP element-mobilizing transposase RayT
VPRPHRNLLEGGLYHVYNRLSSGEEVFADPGEAARFVELIRVAKRRDGFVVYAWCLMSNHYHLALRASAVPLSRTMALVQGGFSRSFNRRHRRSGPIWQSRYQTRLVDDQRYFDELVAYVHLNPVRAGVVTDPADHPLSGHRELLGKVRDPLVDVDVTLNGFADTLRRARREYVRRLEAAIESDTGVTTRLKLPWWTGDRELEAEEGRPFVDVLGRSTGLERARLDAVSFLALACRALGVDPSVLGSGRQDRATTRLRELVAAVGIERWGQRAGALGGVLGKHPDAVSRWARAAALRRAVEPALTEQHEALDRALAEATSTTTIAER